MPLRGITISGQPTPYRRLVKWVFSYQPGKAPIVLFREQRLDVLFINKKGKEKIKKGELEKNTADSIFLKSKNGLLWGTAIEKLRDVQIEQPAAVPDYRHSEPIGIIREAMRGMIATIGLWITTLPLDE